MDTKTTYEVYNAIMKLHKKYAGHVGNAACLPALDGDIKRVTERFSGSKFTAAMTAVLRRWFTGEIDGVPADRIFQFYSDLWLKLHKKYVDMQKDDIFWQMMVNDIHKLDEEYGGCRQLQLYALAIADELEQTT